MKTLNRLLTPLIFFVCATLALPATYANEWEGAWTFSEGSTQRLLLAVDGYWSYTVFEADEPEFHRTFGGVFEFEGDQVSSSIQFDSQEPDRVGASMSLQAELDGTELIIRDESGSVERWQRVDENASPLMGVWRITGRQHEGAIQEMPLRARRTLKVLTGSHFQWIAMNIETGEFSGTGGGTYTFEDGVYTENIEFFSRDNSRVGASLEFEGELRDGDWHHSGLSSRGDPIYEVWSKMTSEEHRR